MKYSVEFMHKNDGNVIVMSGQSATELTPKDMDFIDKMFSEIHEKFPEAFACLLQQYKTAERNKPFFRFLCVRRFIKCNFGNYDIHQYDIDADEVWHLERVNCPLRGECVHEGVICLPKKETGLSQRELEVVALAAQGKIATEIAEKLCLSVYTVNTHIKHILAKLDAPNMKQVVSWWHENRDDFRLK